VQGGKEKKFCLMFKRFANCQDPPHNQRETTKQPYNQQPKKKKEVPLANSVKKNLFFSPLLFFCFA